MTVQTFLPENAITLTDAAIRHLESELAKKPSASAVRLSVKPSGCSGYMYELDLVSESHDDDITQSASDNLTLYIDKSSLPVIQGTELDYIKQGINSLLQFRNPNATSECGCGESFSTNK